MGGFIFYRGQKIDSEEVTNIEKMYRGTNLSENQIFSITYFKDSWFVSYEVVLINDYDYFYVIGSGRELDRYTSKIKTWDNDTKLLFWDDILNLTTEELIG